MHLVQFKSIYCGAVLTYRVEVCTGNLPDAGTDAKVHLMLVGQRGDTGYRQMLKPLSTKSSRPFQPRQVKTTFCEHVFILCCLVSPDICDVTCHPVACWL